MQSFYWRVIIERIGALLFQFASLISCCFQSFLDFSAITIVRCFLCYDSSANPFLTDSFSQRIPRKQLAMGQGVFADQNKMQNELIISKYAEENCTDEIGAQVRLLSWNNFHLADFDRQVSPDRRFWVLEKDRQAFLFQKQHSVHIPDFIKLIQKSDFKKCAILCEVSFSANSHLRAIHGFREWNALYRIEIPSSVEISHRSTFFGPSIIDRHYLFNRQSLPRA
jgi:hypothetical protein